MPGASAETSWRPPPLSTVGLTVAAASAAASIASSIAVASNKEHRSDANPRLQRASLRAIPREHNITFGAFRRKYLATSTPVVLSGVMDAWEASGLSREELDKLCGSGPVFGYCGDPAHSQIKYHAKDLSIKWASLAVMPRNDRVFTNLSQFLAAQQDESFQVEVARNGTGWFGMSRTQFSAIKGRDLYMHDAPIHHHCPALLGKIRAPRFFPANYLKQLGPGSGSSRAEGCGPLGIKPSLFIGAGGSQSGLHIDAHGTRFWMAVMSGTKTWRVVDPTSAAELKRRRPTACDRRTNELLRDHNMEGSINPKLFSEMCPGMGTDLFSGDGDDSSGPVTDGPMVVLEANVSAGEIIFIPELYAHQVRNLDNTIAISNNFLDDYSFSTYITLADALLQFYMAAEKAGGEGTIDARTLRETGRRLTQAGFGRDGSIGFPWHSSAGLPDDLQDSSWEQYAEDNAWRDPRQPGEAPTAARYDAAFKEWLDGGGHSRFFAALDAERSVSW